MTRNAHQGVDKALFTLNNARRMSESSIEVRFRHKPFTIGGDIQTLRKMPL